MKKRKLGKTLSRTSDQRRALKRTLLVSLIKYGRIETTLPKAKELRPFAERMITRAKRGLVGEGGRVTAIRLLKKDLPEKSVQNLFQLAKIFEKREGGYVRIIKLGARESDFSTMALVEWVGVKKATTSKDKAKSKSSTKAISSEKPSKSSKKGAKEDKGGAGNKSSKKETAPSKEK
jgi:large subunit ribosomal protein L17